FFHSEARCGFNHHSEKSRSVVADSANERTFNHPRTPYDPRISPMTTIGSGSFVIAGGSTLRGLAAASRSGCGRGGRGRSRRRGARGLRGTLHEAGDGVRQLGAALLPERDAIDGQPQGFLAFRRDRVVETHALDETAVATVARVGDDYVEERTLLGAAP